MGVLCTALHLAIGAGESNFLNCCKVIFILVVFVVEELKRLLKQLAEEDRDFLRSIILEAVGDGGAEELVEVLLRVRGLGLGLPPSWRR